MILGEILLAVGLILAFCVLLYVIHAKHMKNLALLEKKYGEARAAIFSGDYKEIDLWLARYSHDDDEPLRNLMQECRDDLFLQTSSSSDDTQS